MRSATPSIDDDPSLDSTKVPRLLNWLKNHSLLGGKGLLVIRMSSSEGAAQCTATCRIRQTHFGFPRKTCYFLVPAGNQLLGFRISFFLVKMLRMVKIRCFNQNGASSMLVEKA